MKTKVMSEEEAYRHWDACKDAHGRGDANVTMLSDSWAGGYTVQYCLAGTCTVSRTVSGDVASYAGRWH